MNETVAAAGVFLLATFAPFEPTTPLLQVPGQSLTILELVLLVALMAWLLFDQRGDDTWMSVPL